MPAVGRVPARGRRGHSALALRRGFPRSVSRRSKAASSRVRAEAGAGRATAWGCWRSAYRTNTVSPGVSNRWGERGGTRRWRGRAPQPCSDNGSDPRRGVELDQKGIVAKRADSPYKAGRQPIWRKIKNPRFYREEAVLGWRE